MQAISIKLNSVVKLKGNASGKLVYLITKVDGEATSSNFWCANDVDELTELVKADFIKRSSDDDDDAADMFDEEWCYSIIYALVGENINA